MNLIIIRPKLITHVSMQCIDYDQLQAISCIGSKIVERLRRSVYCITGGLHAAIFSNRATAFHRAEFRRLGVKRRKPYLPLSISMRTPWNFMNPSEPASLGLSASPIPKPLSRSTRLGPPSD